MDPVTLGIVGAGVGAAGKLIGGISANNAANYQAQVAKNNATIARQNAEYSIQAGQSASERSSMKGAANLANIKVGQAASGVDVNTGSAADVQVSQREVNKLDTDTTMNNAALQSYGYTSQATGFEAQAKLDKYAGKSALIGGAIGAAGSLLGDASSLSFKWGGGSTSSASNPSFGGEDLAATGQYGGMY